MLSPPARLASRQCLPHSSTRRRRLTESRNSQSRESEQHHLVCVATVAAMLFVCLSVCLFVVVRLVMEELLQTEEAYVKDLRLIVDVRTHFLARFLEMSLLLFLLLLLLLLLFLLLLLLQRFRPRFGNSDILPNSLKGKEEVIFNNIHQIEAFHRT